ncbi:hypothetical protein B0H14DRAFT_2607692 [Mycena olivaceomarginata]|nr:hypothetical protein B0H14DRAFT_2607692 [Mycena olivaceomarginata]
MSTALQVSTSEQGARKDQPVLDVPVAPVPTYDGDIESSITAGPEPSPTCGIGCGIFVPDPSGVAGEHPALVKCAICTCMAGQHLKPLTVFSFLFGLFPACRGPVGHVHLFNVFRTSEISTPEPTGLPLCFEYKDLFDPKPVPERRRPVQGRPRTRLRRGISECVPGEGAEETAAADDCRARGPQVLQALHGRSGRGSTTLAWYNSGFGFTLARVLGIGCVQELLARLTHTPTVTYHSSTNATLDYNPVTVAAEGAAAGRPHPEEAVVQGLGACTRIIVNDGVVPLTGIDGCAEQKDGMCAVDSFVAAQNILGSTDWEWACYGGWDIREGWDTTTGGRRRGGSAAPHVLRHPAPHCLYPSSACWNQ